MTKNFPGRLAVAVVAVTVMLSVFAGPAEAQWSGTRTDTVCTYNGAIAASNPMGCRRQIRIVDEFPGTPGTYRGTWQSPDLSVWEVECFHASSWETWCKLGRFLFVNVPVPNPTPSAPFPTPTPVSAVVPPTAEVDRIAFTGAETAVLGYVGAGLVAFGAVALGARRKFVGDEID